MIMRHLRYLLTVIAVLLAVACTEKVDPAVPDLPVTYANLDGVWELSTWKGEPLADGSWCYLVLHRRDKTFSIFQNLASMDVREYSGTFVLEEDEYENYVINGEYDWGNGPWTNSYYVTRITSDGMMTWISAADDTDVSVYKKIEALPSFE